MPVVSPNEPRARVGGVWRLWDVVYLFFGAAWIVPRFVWVFHSGAWRIVWSSGPSEAQSPTAALQGDGTVDIDWTIDFPEAADSFTVRRNDNTIVATIPATEAGSYQVTDGAPLVGSFPYFIETTLGGDNISVQTNNVSFGPGADSATATETDNGSSKRIVIAWTGIDPGATEVRVFDPNGSLVATGLPGVDGSANDDSPPANIAAGRYTVRVITAGGQEVDTVTNTIDLARTPTGASVSDGSTSSPDISWDPIVGAHTGIAVWYRQSSDTFLFTAAEDATSIPWPVPAQFQGTVGDLVIAARINSADSPKVVAGAVDIPPNVPAAVSVVATGVLGELRITWSAPSNGEADATGYEVQVLDGSWTTITTQGAAGVAETYVFTGGSGTRSMRVRARSNGGSTTSDWVQGTATPFWDNTPPALPTVTSLKPEASYGRLVYRFTVSDASTTAYNLRWRVNDGAWTTAGWATISPGSYNLLIGTYGEGDDVDVQIQVRDQYLNESSWSSSWRYKLKAQEQFLFPVLASHYRRFTGVWNDLGNGRAYQGYFSDPNFDRPGVLFYGAAIPQACNADGTVGGKITVTSMKITLVRQGGIGDFVENVRMGTTPTISESGSPTAFNIANYGQLDNQGNSVQFTLTTANLNSLRDGTSFSPMFDSTAAGAGTDYLAFPDVVTNPLNGTFIVTSLG